MSGRVTYRDLGEFISRLEAEGELLRVREKASPILEITEMADRMCKSKNGGKALLFENVEGSRMPLLINAFGSMKRIAMALGVDDVEEIAEQVSGILNMAPPESAMDKVRMLSTLMEIAKFPPARFSGRPPCQEVVKTGGDINLDEIPVLKCWPGDAGRFITFPLVFTKGLDGRRNVGMYRMQIFGRDTAGMHWQIHKDGAHQFHEYRKAGKRMEVAVAIGTEPVVTYAATAPLPRGLDELLLAGLIRKKPVRLAKCRTVDLEIPADAEIVLEGYVDPAEELALEGPFGDHTGYYSLADYYPVFHVTAITHRKNPVYSTTVVGQSPMEDCYMAWATSRIFLPMLKTVLPEIKDYNLPWEGVFHNCVIVSMEKEFPAEPHRVMNGMWGVGQMSFAKMILAVDADVDVNDYGEVLRAFLNNLDVKEDLFHSEGILDVLDHSAPESMRGSKLGIDATRRIDGEKKRRLPSARPVNRETIAEECSRQSVLKWNVVGEECRNRVLICSIDKKKAGQATEMAGNFLSGATGEMVSIVMMVDGHVDPGDLSTVMWRFFNNTDPRRDIILRGEHLIIDATRKIAGEGHDREWPEDIVMDEETKKRVDALWLDSRMDS
jgi:4-hydroxy-3-polyprenylbenzoate decarboxylase